MRYLSVCSGIEAATVAWRPLGWEAAAYSEIEAFPRAVLKHHYPDTPCHGDFTTIGADEYGPVDLLVGGTPCQSFSVAGLRGGIHDSRGNLALEFLRLLDRKRPRWVVWENVPGVFSATSHDAPDFSPPDIDLDSDNAPEDGEEVVVEDRYDADESHAFACFLAGLSELGYGFAYRVFDAQYAGVPQRRRRVFVVGYLGDWRRAAAVLFERHSLSGHPAPRRQAREDVARSIRAQSQSSHREDSDNFVPVIPQGYGGEVAPTLNAAFGSKLGLDNQHIDSGAGLFVAHSLRAEGFDASEDGTGRGTPLVPVPFDTTQITSAANYSNPKAGDPCHPLAAGAHAPAVAFQQSQSGFREHDTHATLDANNGSRRHNGVMHGSAVRRLTPLECERLQGFPDNYSLVPYRGKPAADGPRYKSLGNSFAVPVVRWLGERIQMVEELCLAVKAAA